MGRNWAIDLAEQSTISRLRYIQALETHLQYNHVPSVSTDFVPACMRAIKNCSNGKFDKIVLLPNGKRLPSRVVCDGLHLWEWVKDPEDEEGIWRAEGEMS